MHNQTTEAILAFIKAYTDANHTPPTIREIAAGCFVSVGTVTNHLFVLEHTGRIARKPNQARSIVILDHKPR
jgi:SOS-response transcriptional repressor LexA